MKAQRTISTLPDVPQLKAPTPAEASAITNLRIGRSVEIRHRRLRHLWFRLRLALHSRGQGEAARIRGYYRWWVWDEQRRTRGLFYIIRYNLKAPARSWRHARDGIRGHSASVARTTGTSPRRQLLQIWWANLWYGREAENYYRFQLYLPERWRRLPDYVQPTDVKPLYILTNRLTSNGEADMLNDKHHFAAWCAEHGLPAVRTLVRFVGGRVAESPLEELQLPRTSLFSKPASQYGGLGAMIWRFGDDGHYHAADGREFDPSELVAHLARESEREPILLQTALVPHSTLIPIAGVGLPTARLVTSFDGRTQPALEAALLRLPSQGSFTDNFVGGGMVATIDPITGRLGACVRQDPELVVQPIDSHPISRARFTDIVLPSWNEAVELVSRAHSMLPNMPVVGWDVCFLADGLALLEGNANPGVHTPQVADGTPLGNSGWLRELNAHLERIFGPGGPGPGALA